MAIGKNLFKEKTNVGVITNTAFNAPGNYLAPYGKTTVSVGGRGATGAAGNPGNPNTPGNFVPGNYVPGNPTTYVSVTTTWFRLRFIQPSFNSFIGSPNNPRSTSGFDGYFGASYTQNIVYATFYNVGAFTNPGSSNPNTPGNAGTQGATGTAANIGGVAFPGGTGGAGGNAGSPGSAGSTAPLVSPTTTTIEYTSAGFTVTVPSGGYVDIANL